MSIKPAIFVGPRPTTNNVQYIALTLTQKVQHNEKLVDIDNVIWQN